jgi:hypothetical protein
MITLIMLMVLIPINVLRALYESGNSIYLLGNTTNSSWVNVTGV